MLYKSSWLHISYIPSKVELVFRWWFKCISSTISRKVSRNILFSSARISKMINVDRVGPSLDYDSQGNAQSDSRGEDFQAFIDDSDLMIPNQDVNASSSDALTSEQRDDQLAASSVAAINFIEDIDTSMINHEHRQL